MFLVPLSFIWPLTSAFLVTGTIQVAQRLDRDAGELRENPIVSLEVLVRDRPSGGQENRIQITFTVEDINDNPATCSKLTFRYWCVEMCSLLGGPWSLASLTSDSIREMALDKQIWVLHFIQRSFFLFFSLPLSFFFLFTTFLSLFLSVLTVNFHFIPFAPSVLSGLCLVFMYCPQRWESAVSGCNGVRVAN